MWIGVGCTVAGAVLGYLARYFLNSLTGSVKTHDDAIQELKIILARVEMKLDCLPKLKADVDSAWIEIRDLRSALRAPRPS